MCSLIFDPKQDPNEFESNSFTYHEVTIWQVYDSDTDSHMPLFTKQGLPPSDTNVHWPRGDMFTMSPTEARLAFAHFCEKYKDQNVHDHCFLVKRKVIKAKQGESK